MSSPEAAPRPGAASFTPGRRVAGARLARGLLVGWGTLAAAPALAQTPEGARPDSVVAIEPLTVEIGRLRAGTVPLAETPFASHALSADRLTSVGSGGALAGALSSLPGVTLTNQTGSGGQSEIRLRGFTLSPIVGVPQSVSVFVDGVRVNEADASQVHLSLIPEGVIERVELVRGPVGVFGKNSVAGALNFVTRRGDREPTLDLELSGGSFGSGSGAVRASGTLGAVDGLAAASYRRSEGWRWLESAEELSVFAKIGWRGERTDAWLSYTFEADSLEGPGPLPESWIEGGALPPDIVSPPADRRRLQYTGGRGDAFTPTLHFLNASAQRELGERWSLQANAFGRFADFRQANDNISEPDALGLTDIASLGTTLQLVHRPHDLLLLAGGVEASRNDVDIEIREIPNRSFPTLTPATTERLHTDEKNVAAFGEAWWTLTPRLAVYGSIRYDRVDLPVTDVLDPTDSGENTFAEMSGGFGLSADFGAGLGGFAGYGRGFRAPVILEVTCADPADPCQLPFELGPDPPLDPVKSDTWQAGLRLARARAQASLVGYWIEVRDDIFNVIDEDTPTLGYFTNLDRTRRVGVEASAAGSPLRVLPGLEVRASLGYTRATFESSASLASPLVEEPDTTAPAPPPGSTPDDEGGVEVEPGDHFPMVPRFTGSLTLRHAWSATSIEVAGRWTGSQFLIGDEGNEEAFERVAASAVVDLRAEHDFGRVAAFLEVANALDTDFDAYGMISANARAAVERVERFLTPGAPRRLTLGARVSWVGR